MSHLEFDELDRDGAVVALESSVAARLARIRLLAVEPTSAGHWRIVPTGVVGSATLGDRTFTVRPKDGVPIERLMFLLSYARNPGWIADEWTAAEATDNPLLVLAEAFTRALEGALVAGPLQGYVRVDDDSTTVRGRVDHQAQIRRRRGLVFPTHVSFDDYSVDIAENRIVKGAALLVHGIPNLSNSTRRRLTHVIAKLEGTRPVRPGDAIPPWRPTRLNHRYQTALHIGELALRALSLDLGSDGAPPLPAFAVDMAAAFEDFLSAALTQEASRRGLTLELQASSMLDHDASVVLRPDIVQLSGGRTVAIIDAKYKTARERGARNADVYQLLAYCTALGTDTAWLVHAGGANTRGEGPAISIRGADITVRQWTLDLAASPNDVLAQVSALAERVLVGGSLEPLAAAYQESA
ncbi:McrC family protein [Demequina mangrovi]|uniref:5-methylcytosine-specific restriction enzyme subunit McrC n=1 Tax=Demequina mangrovi TaxID=1043493 RepID=A0A1H6ZE15_9MICO|nr:hypothetical protein [Demequina mangrovi]SEJ51641.1 5-methylcytosine-specific restriction enzyme subunit McrC [Demequina mangrovi]